ncbi:MAG: methylmalonic aciduria and homocystinuria type D protein [Cyanobacteria bacterium P01_C01_bin.72]
MLYKTSSGTGVEICIIPPHRFAVAHQQQLLPGWNVPISYLILVIQQSSVSFQVPSAQASLKKDELRTKFLRFGCGLIFALQDCGYHSDLFDPRTGYPLIAQPGMVWDDNAVVKALLNYSVVNHQQCSLVIHPMWQDQVYPATIATTAPFALVEQHLQQAATCQNWTVNY